MNERIFKIGTIVSLKDFVEDTYDTILFIISKKERADGRSGYSYLVHLMHNSDEFWINGSNLEREIDLDEWRIEYEPEEV
jgi:hypothetical protein